MLPMKIRVQICFSADADLEKVREQLTELNANNNYEFCHCFLTREIVEEKGFSTAIVDMFDDVLGANQVSPIAPGTTFEAYKANIQSYREMVADNVNRLYVLDSGTAQGIRDEIELFTSRKVIMLP